MTEKENQQQNMRLGDAPVDLRLAREIRNLDREIQPARDLWAGIERNIMQYPQRKKTQWVSNWMPYGVAASLVIAMTALVLNLLSLNQPSGQVVGPDFTIESLQRGYLQVRNPLVDQFAEVNKNLAPETLEDLYRNIEIMAQARRDIEGQVRQNPENERLVEMLMRIHEQEIELLKQDYSRPSATM